jgi:ABC-type transport system substrate-binding protein
MSPIFQGLYERDLSDPSFLLKPMLASGMPVWNEDNTVAVVPVRDDVKFSNGNNLTAYDVANTYQMHMTEDLGSVSYSGYVSYFKNNSGDYSDSVKALNATAVQFTFEAPYYLAINLMSAGIFDMSVIGTPEDPKGGLLPDDTTNSTAGAEWEFNQYPEHYAVSTGPFKYEATDAVQGSVKLVPNEFYHGGEPKLDTITFTKFGDKAAAIEAVQAEADADHVDIIDAQFYVEISEIENIDEITYKAIADGGTQMMSINMGHPIMGTGVETPLGEDDPTKAAEAANYVRLAISHITPRDTIIDEILKGLGTAGTSLWPDLASDYDDDLVAHPYDLAKAREYMVKAGYVRVTETDYLPLDITGLFLGLFSMGIAAIVLRKKE